ncbi:hypothetical protein JYG23_08950 [Sedimentibacter sp. zth1]|uniref:hypothetical protein n=1 Tax=Sedimentibacter sp. zth1 TaxID=2816908 RepID=UPI001A9257EA|nr:hypothetical protein [Sedimentibacter sp. zth1]QSX04830.1 hypothetical protein JYG23_08950 [Sedimentibacter sp. zth1]
MKNLEDLIKSYTGIVIKKKEECIIKHDNLIKDNRKDEADLEKIKANIYDIFTTMVTATEKQINNKKILSEEEKYNDFCISYLKIFDKIPASWRAKLEKAKKNNAVIESVIEEVKLSVADELRNIFKKLMEEN